MLVHCSGPDAGLHTFDGILDRVEDSCSLERDRLFQRVVEVELRQNIAGIDRRGTPGYLRGMRYAAGRSVSKVVGVCEAGGSVLSMVGWNVRPVLRAKIYANRVCNKGSIAHCIDETGISGKRREV